MGARAGPDTMLSIWWVPRSSCFHNLPKQHHSWDQMFKQQTVGNVSHSGGNTGTLEGVQLPVSRTFPPTLWILLAQGQPSKLSPARWILRSLSAFLPSSSSALSPPSPPFWRLSVSSPGRPVLETLNSSQFMILCCFFCWKCSMVFSQLV